MKQIPHISYSSLALWESCPRSWWAKYCENMELPAGPAAAFGKTYEEALTASLGKTEPPKLDPENPDHAEVKSAVETYGRWKRGWKRVDEVQKKIWVTPEQFENYAEFYGVDASIPVPFLGYTDWSRRMDDGVRWEIIDIKTSKSSGLRAAWTLQGTLYGVFDRAYQVGNHLYVRTKVPKLEEYTWTVTKERAAWALTRVGHIAKQIGEALQRDDPASLPCRPGVNAMDMVCDWCPRQIDCVAKILTGTLCQN